MTSSPGWAAIRTPWTERRAPLLLHGILDASWGPVPPPLYEAMPVVVLARHGRHQAFHRVATVARRVRRQLDGGFPWRLRVQPTTTTTYIAEATYQPGFEFWQDATSRPFAVVVR